MKMFENVSFSLICIHGCKKSAIIAVKPISSKTNIGTSNGNASETKAKESFDNGVFFDIKAKRTPSIVSKLFQNEANTLDRTKIIFEAKRTSSIARQLFSKHKRTCPIVRKLFSKGSEHIT